MKVNVLLIGIITALLSFSCNRAVKPEQLYGEWKYIRVESPQENPPLSMDEEDLREVQPSIQFSKRNDLVIMWGGKKLSHGKFRMEDRMIRFKESLDGGATREFPFLIKEISADKIVFETMSQITTRVTAVRVK